MKALRFVFGLVTLLALAAALNLLAVRRNLFDPIVLGAGVVALLCGTVWLVLVFISMSGSAARRRSFAELNSILASIIFVAICIVLYAMVRRWDQSWDLTQEGRRQLAPQTVQVLENLSDDVTVLGLFSHTGARELDVAREKTRRFLEQCQEHTAHLKVEFIDPQQELARLKAMNLTFADPQGTVVVRCGTRQKTIAFSGPQPRLEERDFTNALINVVQEREPKIGFLTGHGERDITKPEAAAMKKLLESEGYAVQPVAVNPSKGSIPGDVDILVICGFQGQRGGELSPTEIEALDTYVNGGGRMMILVDPEFPENGKAARRTLFTWLDQRFGIVVGDDLLVSRVSGERFYEVPLLPDSAAVSLFSQENLPDTKEFLGCFDQSISITKNFDKRLDFSIARSISVTKNLPDNVSVNKFLRTLPYTYAETNLDLIRQGKQPTIDPNEVQGSLGVGAAATMKTDTPIGDSGQTRDARVVVIGDSDFVSNESILNGGNLNLLLNSMAWLSEREELIAIRPRGHENLPIKLSDADERRVAWISTLGVLHVVAAAGLIMYLFRRKYQ